MKEPKETDPSIIIFLQDRIKNTFQAIESGIGSQFHPFDKVNEDGLKGMKLVYADADVLLEIRKNTVPKEFTCKPVH